MNVTGKTMIFRNEYGERTIYKRGISWKEYKNGQQTNKWQAVYEVVKLPKGTDIPDRTIIDVKEAFESGYQNKDGKLVRQLIVMDFDLVEAKDDFQEIDEEMPF